MSVKAGVWIDHKQAIVVLVTDTGKEIQKIVSGIEKPVRSRSHNPYTPNDFIAEDRLERKFDSHLKAYFDEVIACLKGSEALLIVGPGEGKGEFHKRLMSKKPHGLVVKVETADKMTDRQLAAKMAQHFAMIPTRTSVLSKQTARKKTAKKPTKKSGK